MAAPPPPTSAHAGRRYSQSTVPELHPQAPQYQPVSEAEYVQEQELQEGLSDLNAQLEDMNFHVADMDSVSQQTADAVAYDGYNALDPRQGGEDPSLSVEREVEMPDQHPGQQRQQRGHGLPPAASRAVGVVPGLDGQDAVPRVDTALLKKTSGYLFKKGGSKGGRHNWKRRFFYLKHELTKPSESFELYYFAKESDDVPKGALSLENADIEVDEAQKKDRKNKGHGAFEFQILVGGGRVFEVSCEEEQERQDWVDTLRYVVAVAKRARVSHAAVSRSAQALAQSRSAADQALNCEAFGPGLFGCEAGARAQFTVQANDERGNPHAYGGARFMATLANDDLHYDLRVGDNQDGTYVVQYCTCRAGTYQLFITLGSYDIYGSPFTVTVGAGPAFARACLVRGEGVASATLGATNYFTVVTRDQYENELQQGGTDLQCSVAGGGGHGDDTATLQGFRDNGNGSYSAAFQVAARAGAPPEISVTLGVEKDGATPKHVAGSPFQPALTTEAAVEAPLADGGGGEGGMAGAAAQEVAAAVAQQEEDPELYSQLDTAAAPPPPPPAQAQAQAPAMGGMGGGGGAPPAGAPRGFGSPAAAGGADASAVRAALEQKQREIDEKYAALTQGRRPGGGGGGSMAAPSPAAASPMWGGGNAAAMHAPPPHSAGASGGMKGRLEAMAARAAAMRSGAGGGSPAAAATPSPSRIPTPGGGGGGGGGGSSAPGAASRIPTPGGGARLPAATARSPAAGPGGGIGAVMADPAVAQLFAKHEAQLRAVFGHYSGGHGAPALPLGAVSQLGADFDIVPTFLSRKELKAAAAAGAGGAEAGGLDFGAFVEVLRQCALSALSKPPFDGIYKTEEAKVTVLLEMWGLGDSTKLAKIQRQ
jgi:hypothetical protein